MGHSLFAQVRGQRAPYGCVTCAGPHVHANGASGRLLGCVHARLLRVGMPIALVRLMKELESHVSITVDQYEGKIVRARQWRLHNGLV
jgi:hypothetical protein